MFLILPFRCNRFKIKKPQPVSSGTEAKLNMMPDNNAEFLKSQGFSPTLPERFWAKVNKTEGCWLWTASENGYGYGQIGTGPKRTNRAHVVSWILNKGPIPDGLCVLHRCDIRRCVNPDHLWLGTRDDNNKDAVEKRRNAFGEKHGHCKLTVENIKEIRKLRKTGMAYRQISKLFPVNTIQIFRICNLQRWAHV